MMPFAVDELGRPTFFISSMAMHTQNIQQDARASLLITQPDVSGDPLGAARVTLLGAVTEAAAAEVRDLYLSRYESAKYWQNAPTLPYRLEVWRLLHQGLWRDGLDRSRGLWNRSS
jgi:putative heme iron utilization protein